MNPNNEHTIAPKDTNRTRTKPIKRSGGLRIRISPAVRERLDRIAAMYGVPPSTLASLAVGAWVSQNENSLGVVQKMADSVGGQMGEQFRLLAQGLMNESEDSTESKA